MRANFFAHVSNGQMNDLDLAIAVILGLRLLTEASSCVTVLDDTERDVRVERVVVVVVVQTGTAGLVGMVTEVGRGDDNSAAARSQARMRSWMGVFIVERGVCVCVCVLLLGRWCCLGGGWGAVMHRGGDTTGGG